MRAEKKIAPSSLDKSKKTKEPIPFSLRAVYLREGRQWIKDDFDPVIPGQTLFGQFRATGHRIESQEAIENIPDAKPILTCRFTTNFEFRYLNASPDNQTEEEKVNGNFLVAEISARFTVDYLIGTPEFPPAEKLEQWASGNALLHCWPYWREFCHSTLLRMSLPVTMMPMMEVNQKAK
jgi:hypothetical protein